MKNLAFALLLAAAASIFLASAPAQVLIIVSPDIKVESISRDDVRSVFTGASSNVRFGPHVNPVLLKRCAAHDEFLSTYVGMMEVQFRSNWRGLLFAGQRGLPPSLDSEADVVDYVAHHNFAIGYVGKATSHPGVKVLAVK